MENVKRPNVVAVVPTIRPESMAAFRTAWAPLFEKHGITLITVWDGEDPKIEAYSEEGGLLTGYYPLNCEPYKSNRDIFCRRTDAVRNLGFVESVNLFDLLNKKRPNPDYILTLDDDVHPPAGSDPIREHLDVLNRRVPISWMNTALDAFPCVEHKDGRLGVHGGSSTNAAPYLRGFPYSIREESPVMVSHGVWVNVPDFDGRTQLELTANGTRPQDLPYSLPYFRGPIPRGVFAPISGMNLMVRKEVLPYLYFAPMGPDSGYPDLHRFADIWMGIRLKQMCDSRVGAIYTGASTVIHTRASDPHRNVEQERLGMEWNEWMWKCFNEDGTVAYFHPYVESWMDKANRFRDLILKLQEGR